MTHPRGFYLPSELADPRVFEGGDAYFELRWSPDETVAVLDIIVRGSKRRIEMTTKQLDLLRQFLNANFA
jgi:hypothetical protein